VAIVNFLVTNYQLQKIMCEATKAVNMSLKNLKYLRELDALKKAVFDSNTVTFLVSFFLVGLGTMFLHVFSNYKKNITDEIEKIKAERNSMFLHSQILSLRVLSVNFQNAIDLNMVDSIHLLNYRTHRMAVRILKDFRDDKYKYITKEGKSVFIEIFENMIYDFGMESVDEETPENDPRKRFQKSINMTISVLKDLRREISRLREV